MPKAKNTHEEVLILHGHVHGLKREIDVIKNNDLKHMKEDIDRIEQTIENIKEKIDRLNWWLVLTLGGIALQLLIVLVDKVK